VRDRKRKQTKSGHINNASPNQPSFAGLGETNQKRLRLTIYSESVVDSIAHSNVIWYRFSHLLSYLLIFKEFDTLEIGLGEKDHQLMTLMTFSSEFASN
jgi:hypothetical protein